MVNLISVFEKSKTDIMLIKYFQAIIIYAHVYIFYLGPKKQFQSQLLFLFKHMLFDGLKKSREEKYISRLIIF